MGYPYERKSRTLEYHTIGKITDPVQIIRPKQLQFGFGTFSYMDMYHPQNYGQVDLTAGGVYSEVNPIITNVNGTSIAFIFKSNYPILGASGTNFG